MSALQLWYFFLTEAKRRKKLRHTKVNKHSRKSNSQENHVTCSAAPSSACDFFISIFSPLPDFCTSRAISPRCRRRRSNMAIKHLSAISRPIRAFQHLNTCLLLRPHAAAFFFHPPRVVPVGTAAKEFLKVFTNILNLALLFHIERARSALVCELQNERFLYFSPSLVVVVVARNIFLAANTATPRKSLHASQCVCTPPVLREINVNC